MSKWCLESDNLRKNDAQELNNSWENRAWELDSSRSKIFVSELDNFNWELDNSLWKIFVLELDTSLWKNFVLELDNSN